MCIPGSSSHLQSNWFWLRKLLQSDWRMLRTMWNVDTEGEADNYHNASQQLRICPKPGRVWDFIYILSNSQKIRNYKDWVMAASVRCLSCMCEDLSLLFHFRKKIKKPGMVAHAYSPSAKEVETGEYLCVPRQPALPTRWALGPRERPYLYENDGHDLCMRNNTWVCPKPSTCIHMHACKHACPLMHTHRCAHTPHTNST